MTNFVTEAAEESKSGKAKGFLEEMKRSLSQVNFQLIMQALQTYKKTDSLEELLGQAANLFTADTNTHSLFRGRLFTLCSHDT